MSLGIEYLLEYEAGDGFEPTDEMSEAVYDSTVMALTQVIKDVKNVAVLRFISSCEINGKNRKGVLEAIGPAINALVIAPEELASPEEPEAVEGSTSGEMPLVARIDGLPLFDEIVHVTRIISPLGGMSDRVVTAQTANAHFSNYVAEGYWILRVIPLNYGPEGLSIMWVMGKPRDGEAPPYSEVHHIVRSVAEKDDVAVGAVSGFQANAYVSSFLREDWRLHTVEVIGPVGTTIPTLWVLVR